ncbi:rhomboid family intramembrane serine protease [Desulfosarcina alkanivorans]|uniref:Rhomboid family intramembrane serine protease n=1 Tax=Desulfosarcina alkanivorans TaxID=571177 RepID=A0A5K7YPK1_9BACT|nr:rhomboid family intramembrane serine protease [Desulfosarcina alkanivorans]BBO68294.1 rhomboid family intramembrane serine protease [Desulfosarcina alkanivorans]
MVPIFNHLSREQAKTFSLVLNSSGIGNRVVGTDDGFRIEVPEPYTEAARNAIGQYQAENPEVASETPADGGQPTFNLSGIVVAILLLCVHLSVFASAAPRDYVTVFGASAHRIMAGELYRCATALLLHADAAHIAGNMVAMVLFGGAVCAVTGSGVGWLMIAACGISGNLLNAFAYGSGHLSVGASTGVFGAVGILCSLQAVNAARSGRGWKRTILVFGAGAALLAFLGASARSDLGAHLFGFLSGAVMGGAYRLWMTQPLEKRWQILCATIAAAGLVLSWVRGATR